MRVHCFLQVMAAVIASNEVAKIMAQIRQGESRLDTITASAAGLEQQLKTLMTHKGESTDTPHPMFEQVRVYPSPASRTHTSTLMCTNIAVGHRLQSCICGASA